MAHPSNKLTIKMAWFILVFFTQDGKEKKVDIYEDNESYFDDNGTTYEKRIDQNGFMVETTIDNGEKTTRSIWPAGNVHKAQYVNDQIVAQRKILLAE